jgi:hypothetical protein
MNTVQGVKQMLHLFMAALHPQLELVLGITFA